MGASLDKKEREEIFKLFLSSSKLKFHQIEKKLGIRSNMVSYHLEKMQKDGLIEKKNDDYVLTKYAEKIIPFFSQITTKEVGVLCVVLVAIRLKNKILLLKRNKRPYKDYWGMIGGKVHLSESIGEAALRKAKEEAKIDCEFVSINAVVHERLKSSGDFKNAFVLFMTTVHPKSTIFKQADPQRLKWFELKKLKKEDIIPSDYFMIKNLLNKKSDVIQVVMEEKDERLVSFKRL